MWTDTAATRRLGIRFPIIQGPFGGSFSTVRLAAAVSNVGGLGSFGAQAYPAAEIRRIIGELRAATNRPFAINLWVNDRDEPENAPGLRAQFAEQLTGLKPFHDELGAALPEVKLDAGEGFERQVEAVLDARPPVFSFVFGIPAPAILEECRRRGIVTIGAATSVEEARANEAAGVDLILATGFEAGGHRPSFLRRAEDSLFGTMSLVPRVVDAVTVPVVAAGGIADGRGVAAALRLGAGAVQIGTAFLACEESGASEFHRSRILGGHAADTVLSRAYTGRLARFIRNRFLEETSRRGTVPLPFPYQSYATANLNAAAVERHRDDLAGFYAGQGASLVRHHRVEPLFRSLVEESASHSQER
jgi:nitronate monooxygenase